MSYAFTCTVHSILLLFSSFASMFSFCSSFLFVVHVVTSITGSCSTLFYCSLCVCNPGIDTPKLWDMETVKVLWQHFTCDNTSHIHVHYTHCTLLTSSCVCINNVVLQQVMYLMWGDAMHWSLLATIITCISYKQNEIFYTVISTILTCCLCLMSHFVLYSCTSYSNNTEEKIHLSLSLSATIITCIILLTINDKKTSTTDVILP